MFIIVWLSKEGVSGRGHGVDGLRDFNQRGMCLSWIRSVNGIAAENTKTPTRHNFPSLAGPLWSIWSVDRDPAEHICSGLVQHANVDMLNVISSDPHVKHVPHQATRVKASQTMCGGCKKRDSRLPTRSHL